MLEIYRAVEPYFAVLGITAVSAAAIVAAAFAGIKWFGERWITAKFSERLEAFKHAQQQEIEHLKFQINASMDRAVKLHQKEFEVVPEAWASLVMTVNTVKAFTSAFQSYADLQRMNADELDEFFEGAEFTKSKINEIRAADDINKAYQEAVFSRGLNKTIATFRDHHTYVLKNAIFMTPDMERRFRELGDFAWDALQEHRIGHELRAEWKDRDKRERFEEEGTRKLNELQSEVQKRLWSGAQIPATNEGEVVC